MDERIALGRIGRAHGVGGAFRVWPYADDLDRFQRLRKVVLSRETKSMVVTVTQVRPAHGCVIIQTGELTTPEDIRPWIDGDLEIDARERITLPRGRFFHDEVIGLRVVTTGGETVGEIARIIESPANDVYVCRNGDRECLIPAVDEFVKTIDPAAGIITIQPIPGLLD